MGQEEAKGYKKLKVWQKADELAVAVFGAMNSAPQKPRWLMDQVARAAVSVPANVAEGYSRGSLGDYLRFLDIARGSLAEVEYYLHFMDVTGLLDMATTARLNELQDETGNLLFGLIRSLAEKQRSGEWDRSRKVKEDPAEYHTGAGAPIKLFEVFVAGRPPLHEAAAGYSLHNSKHSSYQRAESLKQKARELMGTAEPLSAALILEIKNTLRSPQGDAANVIQAIFTALEEIVYNNDSQIKEVHYIESEDVKDGYLVRFFER